ncbi:MAG: PQQ-binding-like beta-propeller repeat protein [Deltaproteobacteria bacterium]|nr:PQQ-binding-like beta-propeller repeat protein [Deltaproteobacteria bacterium]
MIRKGWLFVLLFYLVAGCSPGDKVAIEKVTFGRGAIAIRLNGKARVQNISVGEGSKEVASKEIGAEAKEFLVDLNWHRGREYRIKVTLGRQPLPLVATCRAPERPSPLVLASLDLEDVDPHQLRDYCYIGGIVAISPEAKYLAVGSEKGYLRLVSIKNGRLLWSKRIGEGRIVAMAFSPDGRYLALGEQSRDAFIYLYDIAGRLLWKFPASRDVGTIRPGDSKYHLPVVNSLVFAPSGNARKIYFTARHYLGTDGRNYRHRGKVYCLDMEGHPLWTYPGKGYMDASPEVLRMDARGKYLIFSNYWKGESYNKSLYCLDGQSGQLLWSWDFRHLFPEKRLGIWHGVDISADGTYVAAFSNDGRGFLLSNSQLINTRGKKGLVWEKTISAPITVNGLSIYGFPAQVKIGAGYVAFLTGNTNARQGKRRPAIEHPNANSLFVYDLKGTLQWTSRVGGASYTDRIHTSADSRYTILPIRYNRVEKDSLLHGVYLFDNSRPGGAANKLVWFFHTDGMSLSADISRDGKYIALLEYPVDMDIRDEFQDIKGKHRVYILR